ncbi:MAG: hypothetical protein R3A10_19300 [Caldilineaceae bacterium]
MAESILTTWIFNHTHGSVLPLFHAATDAALVYTGVVSGKRRSSGWPPGLRGWQPLP